MRKFRVLRAILKSTILRKQVSSTKHDLEGKNIFKKHDFEEKFIFKEHGFEKVFFLKADFEKNFPHKKSRFGLFYQVKCASFAFYVQF